MLPPASFLCSILSMTTWTKDFISCNVDFTNTTIFLTVYKPFNRFGFLPITISITWTTHGSPTNFFLFFAQIGQGSKSTVIWSRRWELHSKQCEKRLSKDLDSSFPQIWHIFMKFIFLYYRKVRILYQKFLPKLCKLGTDHA